MSVNPRQDLLHLKPEALAQASNAGIVKRAVRELQGGYRPQWVLDADGTLNASFSDGIRTIWPTATPILQVRCSCGSATVCRHRIIVALAYRETALADQANVSTNAATTPPVAAQATSPGQASDETLSHLIPATLLTRATAARSAGLSISLRRAASGEPCDTARLPSATVRFWAGAALEAARCDCIAGSACEHVALGVWAFRQADEDSTKSAEAAQIVRLGNEGTRLALDTTPWIALVEALLLHGVSHGSAPIAQAMSHALDASRAINATWLVYLLQDLEHWSGAWLARSASYQATDGVALVSELALRLHAGVLPGSARAVLGLAEPGETELDRLRLLCLGARTLRDGLKRRTRLMLVDTDTATAMVLNHEWQVSAGDADESDARAAERLAPGLQLQALSNGQLLARKARRLPDGSLKLAKARSSDNSTLPQVPDWSQLAAPLRYDSVRALADAQQAHPTAQVLPRHAAQRFVVFTPARIESLSYDPHSQSLMAVLYDKLDHPVLIKRSHESHNRHALASLAQALSGKLGAVDHVSGLLHWSGGFPIIEPWALATSNMVVPDFAVASIENNDTLAQLPIGFLPDEIGDPISKVLASLNQILSTLLHHGFKALPASWKTDCQQVVRQLKIQSLFVLADQLNKVLEATLNAQARPKDTSLATALMQLAAIAQLHRDSQVISAVESRNYLQK
ncbi:MAG: hypothetical protein EAZ37_12115 [Burkholderiales bacterium]|nr:MAG: hypothetical protein EAZ37_12115 [Burkholderiales bacterium]